MTMRLRPRAATGAGALAALVAGAVPAAAPAATKNGITPKRPKAGATVAEGSRPTFRFNVKGAGTLWVHVCTSRKRDSEGLICTEGMISQAKRKGSTGSIKAKFFDFETFWLNAPGTYYWQAFRIDCEGDLSDCNQEGPVVKFRVG